jgi:threonine dehydrogenase-like Zn-dependent dehydrogenase
MRQTTFQPGDSVLIIGDGPVGLGFLQLAKLMGAGRVAIYGRRPARLRLAELARRSQTL